MNENAQVSIEKVNPATAKLWLEKAYSGQRTLREGWVERLAEEMKQGKFTLSSDCIVLINGTLANGQHRLRAIVQSGVTCRFVVMKTDDEKLYEVIDCGIKRTVADITGGENATTVAAIANLALAYECKVLTSHGKGGYHTLRSEQVAFIKKHQAELQQCAFFSKSLYMKNKFLPTSVGGALLFLLNKAHPGKGDEFVNAVYVGGDIPPVIQDIRNSLINKRLSRTNISTSYQFGLLIKSFNSWMKGTRPGVLRIAPEEEYPRIIEKV